VFTAPGAPPHPCRSWHALRDAARFAAVGDRVEPAMAKELVEAPIERPVRVVVSAVVRVEKLPYKGINVGVRKRDASALTHALQVPAFTGFACLAGSCFMQASP
jgi:hypothetical protein